MKWLILTIITLLILAGVVNITVDIDVMLHETGKKISAPNLEEIK